MTLTLEEKGRRAKLATESGVNSPGEDGAGRLLLVRVLSILRRPRL